MPAAPLPFVVMSVCFSPGREPVTMTLQSLAPSGMFAGWSINIDTTQTALQVRADARTGTTGMPWTDADLQAEAAAYVTAELAKVSGATMAAIGTDPVFSA